MVSFKLKLILLHFASKKKKNNKMTTKKRNKAERSQDRVRITFKELKQVSDSPSNGAERYRQPLQYVCRALTRKTSSHGSTAIGQF